VSVVFIELLVEGARTADLPAQREVLGRDRDVINGRPSRARKEGPMKSRRLRAIAVAAAVVAGVTAVAVVLVPLARERSENVRLGKQWAGLLKQHSTFSGRQPAYAVDIAFSYAARTDQDLSRLRETYDLEAIAGRGSEAERLINLMAWVHRLTGHANEPHIPKELNAFNLIRLAKVEHMQINCYMKTVILNEVYLAMGWPSRQTHLLPHSHEEDESHFVTSVYAGTLGGWVLMDPDFGAYLTDDVGHLLGVSETRSRLIAGRPVVVKDVDAGGRLATARENARDFIQGADYIWFLTDFVFKTRCPQRSLFNQAAEESRAFFELIPDGYREELLQAPTTTKQGRKIVHINDERSFWQAPPP
jgi:hypothetical protein